MKASPRQQSLLLSLQEADTALLRLNRRQQQLNSNPELESLKEEETQAKRVFFERHKVLEDLNTEIAKMESDVDLVKQRRAVTSERLATSNQAKEATALQEEMEALDRRTAALEELELGLMEQAEEAGAALNDSTNELADIERKKSVILEQQAAEQKQIDEERGATQNERDGLSAEIQGDLRELYERTRERYGIAVAELVGRVSGGSNMELDAADFAEAMATPADELYFCPVSGAILVRENNLA